MSKYEKHLREYTVVGATAVFQPMVSKDFIDFYGGSFEIISVVKDGFFYHYQIPSDRLEAAKKFLYKVERDKIDLEKEYKFFSDLADQYLDFINNDNFSLNTISKFFNYYKVLLNIAIPAMDCVDVIEELSADKRENFMAWAEKTRKKEEPIYKNGEMVFMPKYLKWLSENILTAYSVEELRYLVCTELIDFIGKNKALPSPEELRNRKKLFYVRQYPVGGLEFFSGSEAQKQIDLKGLDEKVDSNIKEFKGTSAFFGKVSGRVKVVKNLSDMSKFLDGEVLVASMTEPAYLPIMKKAVAFITNEGGILCHAAIVARELKKPCIIGTKIATEVLQDGDLVEVDAENGIVRKI